MVEGENREEGAASHPPAPALEDLVVLQSTVESLRQERDQLLRRLQVSEATARERVAFAESRTREAAAQVEALKRAAQTLREQLEARLEDLQQQHHQAQEHGRQWQLAAEGFRRRATELETLLEATQIRVADLETENAVLQGEIERLQQELERSNEQAKELRSALEQLTEERQADRQAAEAAQQTIVRLLETQRQLESQLQEVRNLAAERSARSDTLTVALHEAYARIDELETAVQALQAEFAIARTVFERDRAVQERCAAEQAEEWARTRDALARALEEEQNRNVAVERELGTLRAQLCSLQLRNQLDAEEQLRLEEELRVARSELERERGIYEDLLRRQQAEWSQQLEELQQTFDQYRNEREQELSTLRQALENAKATSARYEQDLEQLRQTLSGRTEELRTALDRLAKQSEYVGALEHTLRAEQAERAAAETLAAELRQALEQMEARARKLETECARLQELLADERSRSAQQKSEFEEQCSNLHAALARQGAEARSARAELDRLRIHYAALEQQLARATVTLHGSILDAAEARCHAAQQGLAYRLLVQEHERREVEHESQTHRAHARQQALEETVRTLDIQRSELQRETQTLREALDASQRTAQELKEQETALRSSLDQARGEIARLDAALAAAQSRSETLERELAAARSQAEALLAERATTLATHQQEVERLEHERQRAAAEIAALEAALEAARRKHDQVHDEYAAQVAALRAEVDEWRERLEAAEQLADTLRAELETTRRAAAAPQTEAPHWQEQCQLLEQRLQALARELDEERSARARTLSELEATKLHLETLQEQSVAILQSQEVLSQEHQTLRAEYEALQQALRQLEQANTQALREREAAVQRLREVEAARQKEQSEYFAIRQQLDAERERLRNALEAARAHQAQLQAQITLLQNERAARPALSNTDFLELERERAELKTQVEKLSAVIRQLGQEREEQRVAALQAQAALTARIDELAAERGALSLRVAELETLANQLDRECERLRRERLSPEELRKYKAEISRLEARVEELERLRAEAAQNHSAVVANYLVELNQRTEALQAKEAELERLQRQFEELRTTFDDLQAQLEIEREERVQAQAALQELRRAATGSAAPVSSKVAKGKETAAAESTAKNTSIPLRLAESGAKYTQPTETPVPQTGLARLRSAAQLTVIHLEENKDCREQVQRLVRQLPNVRYLNTMDIGDPTKESAVLLAVNLLNRAHDPIAALARIVRHRGEFGVFAYCSEGTFGFLFGDAAFFPSPFEVDACTTWLLSSLGSVQRLLVASNNIEMTSELRNSLSRIRCSTSVALDFRQVMELLPLIQPEVVLVDLSLPRADGLRLVSRLRNDEKTAALPLGVILPEHERVAEFRRHAGRAAREGSLSVEQLVRVLAKELGLQMPSAKTPAAAPNEQAAR